MKMNLRKMMSIFCCAFSSFAFAESASSILFDQAFNISANQEYILDLDDIQAGDHVWTAIYLVAKQDFAGGTIQVDFLVDTQGLLNKENPSEHQVITTLVAEDLQQTQYYSFKQFKKLKQLIEKKTDQTVEDPILSETDTIRIYTQVNDWIPEYNSYEPTQVKFMIQNPVDLKVAAIYVLVGKGAKPSELAELNLRNRQSVLPIKTTSIAPESTHSTDVKFNRVNIKLIFLFGAVLSFIFFAFIYRKKLRHYS